MAPAAEDFPPFTHPADIQDRYGAGIVIQAIHDLFP
jgi:hypothetical protein